MCKLNKKSGLTRIDPCMRNLIEFINEHSNMVTTVACCCGHGKYPMTIVLKDSLGLVYDLMSGIEIPRKKKFYKKDKQGYYYIPETLESTKVPKDKRGWGRTYGHTNLPNNTKENHSQQIKPLQKISCGEGCLKPTSLKGSSRIDYPQRDKNADTLRGSEKSRKTKQ